MKLANGTKPLRQYAKAGNGRADQNKEETPAEKNAVQNDAEQTITEKTKGLQIAIQDGRQPANMDDAEWALTQQERLIRADDNFTQESSFCLLAEDADIAVKWYLY